MNNGGWITCKNGVHRVDGELAVSRAIGDRNIKKFIIAEPECYHHTLEADDDMLILSSDGLLLVYKEDRLAKTISEMRRKQGNGQAPHTLAEMSNTIMEEACQDYYCRDNVSLVLVDLKKHYEDNEKKRCQQSKIDFYDFGELHLQRRNHSQLALT